MDSLSPGTMRELVASRELARFAPLGPLGQVCRLGLATRTGNALRSEDIFLAVDRGIHYLNWPGQPDALSEAIRSMSAPQRQRVVVAVQLEATKAAEARQELEGKLRALGTDYLDVVTYYYVERQAEWDELTARGGAAEAAEAAKREGMVRMIGLTSHQRRLAVRLAQSGRLEMLMIRYNAAHRGAEAEVFPVTDALRMPVVTYTSLRWQALLQPTAEDPAGFVPPPAREWYRFALCHPSVSVALMAPHDRRELEENLWLLDDWRGLSAAEYATLAAHGQRVRRHAGAFP